MHHSSDGCVKGGGFEPFKTPEQQAYLLKLVEQIDERVRDVKIANNLDDMQIAALFLNVFMNNTMGLIDAVGDGESKPEQKRLRSLFLVSMEGAVAEGFERLRSEYIELK